MDLENKITDYSLRHYKLLTILMVIFTVSLGTLIPFIEVDTDPENMLSEDEPVRVFHNETKRRFALSDIVVVGVVNDKDPNGVFNPSTLDKIYQLTQFAKEKLRWPDEKDPNRQIGVVEVDILAPSTVDHIGQGSPGEVRFEWLMPKPPATRAEAIEVRDKALSNPLLKGTVVSEDGRMICLYLPLTSKDLSHRVYKEIGKKIATFKGDEQYHITGLPVAEDTFGYEMFIQMAISAPLAMLTIFILKLIFFGKLVLVIAPIIVALVSVISTMGLLIGLGYPVHIMSSMIPIFLMPIAVVDSVHILSEFFDRYTHTKGRRDTVMEVMRALFTPMLYTSLTSTAGFLSLALTPIPPVQVFGVFVGAGIMIAWVVTVTFVPAYIMMVREKSLENFGLEAQHGEKATWLTRLLHRGGGLAYSRAKYILTAFVIISGIAVYGITRIEINDNPIKWFSQRHPIRRADIVLNEHFGGTYMAYLVLEPKKAQAVSMEYVGDLRKRFMEKAFGFKEQIPDVLALAGDIEKSLLGLASKSSSKDELLRSLSLLVENKYDNADQKHEDFWYELLDFFELEKERIKVFKQPEMLRYISGLQEQLAKTGLVGKSNSVADVVKKVHQELIDGKIENYKIPDSSAAVAQCLLQFQSSHNPDDLWHLVTTDYMSANVWLQLTSGDNKDMEKVVKEVNLFIEQNPPPVRIEHKWAGLTYINTVWQDKMVWGMLQSFLGSFIIVFIMMAILFRSPLWGFICMIPLTITIGAIYGFIGLGGKDYDMPVAVLSALTLGMAVDFAIHFLERAKVAYGRAGSWGKAAAEMFGEPARAISRNVLVIAIGFLPLLAAPLVPYKTVGIFVCAIMAFSGVVTLVVLPAIVKLAEKSLFKPRGAPVSAGCNCGFCMIISVAAAFLVALNLHRYWKLGWSKPALLSIITIPIMALVCGIMSRRQACKSDARRQSNESEV